MGPGSSGSAADGLEGGELACVGPGLLVHYGDVLRAPPGRIRGVDDEAVVHPGHDLLLAAHDAAEPQPVAGQVRLLRLAQRPRAELLDVRVALHVRDRAPPAQHLADGLEGGELACVGPGLLVHDGHVLRAPPGRIRGVDDEAVVHPGHDLLLASHDAAEPQPVAGQVRLLRLRQRPRAELLDVLVVLHVRDRAPPAQRLATAAEPRGVSGGDLEGYDGEREEEEREPEGPRHGCRLDWEGRRGACLLWLRNGTGSDSEILMEEFFRFLFVVVKESKPSLRAFGSARGRAAAHAETRVRRRRLVSSVNMNSFCFS
jgi:hypothetical protein